MKKKLLSLILAIALLTGLLPAELISAQAAEADLMAHPVTGGNIYFDPNTGTVTDCDSSVTEANIPTAINGVTVTSIGHEAFAGCFNLIDITIPDSVTSIGIRSFYDCDSLTGITIPDSVTSIGNEAFDSCASLTNITIPDSVTTIEGYTFSYCSSLTSITIPDSVTSIGFMAFYRCGNLTDITLPSSVTFIGNNAFSDCDSLTSITIPDGVTSIEDSTFENCSSLSSVTIPDSVTSIGNSAFAACSSLTSITIPLGVTSIGDAAFTACDNLSSISVDNGNKNYCSDSNGILFDKDKTTLIQAPAMLDGTYIIPDSVTSIGYMAFNFCSNLTGITLPNGVTSIENNAFSGCSSLSNIEIPDSVTFIGDNAFSGCSSLTSIAIPDGVTSIMPGLFVGCDSLTNVTIPDSVTYIGYSAFQFCNSLTSLTIPDSVTSIDPRAFNSWAYNCENLTLHVAPDSYAHQYAVDNDISYTLDHVYTAVVTAPSCTKAGFTTYTCACGDSYVSDETEVLPHDYKSEITKPTCTEEGYTTYTCTHCGENYRDDFTDKADHNWNSGVITKEPTEEAAGIRTFTCTVCGETKTESVPYVPGHEHSYTEVVTKPTCTESGYTTYTCECGNIYTGNVVDALDHDFKAGVCSRCGAEDPDYTENELLKNFKDMPDENNWAYDGIVYCVEKGLMNGISETAFSPNGTVSRAQLVTILYRAAGSPATEFKGTFTDVPDGQWYSKAIEWAAANGVVNGIGDGKFGPDQSITREQIATILYRYENQPAVSGSLDSFPDKGNVSGFAVTGMIWATGEKLINGVSSNGVTSLAPKNNATRAQIAAIIMRYLEN